MATFREYGKFCQKIEKSGVRTFTARYACDHPDVFNSQFLIIKHDVESNLAKAFKLSRIEHQYGIHSTYYIHSFFLDEPGNISMLHEMVQMGHEIGYHYDVLDNNDGDKVKAMQEFSETLGRFSRQGLEVRTLCPHGNPLKKRVGYSSNKDFFLDNAIREEYPLVEDIYITFPDIIPKDYLYITDAQYSYFYRDAKSTKTDATEKLTKMSGIDDVLGFIDSGQSIILSTHSHRYVSFAFIGTFRYLSYKLAKTVAKIIYKSKIGKYFIDKFYYLAKNI